MNNTRVAHQFSKAGSLGRAGGCLNRGENKQKREIFWGVCGRCREGTRVLYIQSLGIGELPYLVAFGDNEGKLVFIMLEL